MLAVKQNLGPNDGGLAFRIETQDSQPRLDWASGAVSLDANSILNIEDREDHSERKDAEEWLREYLADGPIGAREAIRAANDVGITKSTLWRAANSLRVAKRKLGGRGAGWEWSLQESKNSGPADARVDSLNSLTNPVKTKVDSGNKNPKISAEEYMRGMESLPLTVDGEEEGEIRV